MTAITNVFVREYAKSRKLNVESFDEARDWGGFYILASGMNYDVKILWVKPGELLSLQCHGTLESPGHDEVWTALTNVRVIRGASVESLEIIDRVPGSIVTIDGGVMHCLANPFAEDDVYVSEVRISSGAETPQQREQRIVRVYDKYERADTPPYPPRLQNEILQTPFHPRLRGVPISGV